jgi:transposase
MMSFLVYFLQGNIFRVIGGVSSSSLSFVSALLSGPEGDLGGVMSGQADHDGKVEALRASRTLNPRPEAVTDPAFAAGGFFDARDLVQVKYEMVRRVDLEQVAVSVAAQAFGFCRQSVYTARQAVSLEGMAALVPAKPGPKGGHKLTGVVVDHLLMVLQERPDLGSKDLAQVVADEFGVRVHPRSVERALARRAEQDATKSI